MLATRMRLGGLKDLTYSALTNADISAGSSTSVTESGYGIGAAPTGGDRRFIFIAVAFKDMSGITYSSFTIGGQSGTIVGQAQESGGDVRTMLGYAEVASGTTGDVVITVSSSMSFNGALQGFRVISGSAGITEHATAVTDEDGGQVVDLNINAKKGGFVIALMGGANVGTSSWTGVTEAFDYDFDAADYLSSGAAIPSSTASPRTVSDTQSDSTPGNLSGISGSFRP